MLTEHDIITIRFALESAMSECNGLHLASVPKIFRRHLEEAKEKRADENAVELAALLVSIALQGKRV